MDAETNVWFAEKVKALKEFERITIALGKELPALRAAIIQHENDLVSLKGRLAEREEALADVEKQIKERRALADQGSRQVHEELNKKHLDLVAREAKVRISEKAAAEQLDKANALLTAAEAKAARRIKVEA